MEGMVYNLRLSLPILKISPSWPTYKLVLKPQTPSKVTKNIKIKMKNMHHRSDFS